MMRAGIVALLLLAAPVLAADAPDLATTPGVVRALTTAQVCATKWGRDARHVTPAMRREVFRRYGYSGPQDPRWVPDAHGRAVELDHLISRELGGADDVQNLWPEPYGGTPWSATEKDRLENTLHRLVCAGTLPLAEAQRAIRENWIAAYQRYVNPRSAP